MHLFAKKGEELKLEETEEFAKIIANAKRDILAQMAMREVLGGITVTEEEMQAHYEANKQAYSKGETVSAKHILVKEEEKCQEILEEIIAGKVFEEAAQQYSTCPSGQKGGDLGEFGKGQMVKEFEEEAFKLEVNAMSKAPVATDYGYHILWKLPLPTEGEEYDKAYSAAVTKMWRNKAVVDAYEPGSTFKLITTSSALEEKAISLNDTFTCNTYVNVAGINLHCWSPRDHGNQTVKQAVGNSCNPAHAKIAAKMGKQAFYKYINLFFIR